MALAQKAVRGAAWTVGSSMAARLIAVVATLLITRYLDPEVIGEVTSASIVVVSANMLSNFGLGNYAVAKHREGPDVTFACTVLYLGIGVIALGGVWQFGAYLSDTVSAPNMGEYVPGLVLAIFIRRLGHIPDKVLAREMRFGPIGLATTLGELTYALASVGLAIKGWGGMAIVWANVAQSVVMTGIVTSQVNWRSWLLPHKLRWERFVDQARFGIPLGLVASAHYASTTWDNLIYSRFFGAGQMGLYNLGYKLAALPADQIGEHVGNVLFPSMSNVDGDAKRRGLVRSIALMSLLVFPLGAGLFAVADSLVATVLPPKWQGVTPVLSALALITLIQPIGWASGSYLLSKGYSWALSIQEFVKLIAVGLGVVLLAPYGSVWACAGVAIGFSAQALIYLYLLGKDGVDVSSIVSAMLRPVLPCIPMVAAVFGLRHLLRGLGVETPAIYLISEILIGAVVFVPMAFILARPIAEDFWYLIRSALKRGQSDD